MPPGRRARTFAYTEGLLTAVPACASPIPYNSNQTVAQVTHVNGITDVIGLDPNALQRPASILARNAAGTNLWNAGTYSYDGSGNIKLIGGSGFAYDPASRLITANLWDGTGATGTPLKTQGYSYDLFGNLQAITGQGGRNTPTSSTTNRLNGAGMVYDAAGNQTNNNGAVHEYDPFHLMWHFQSGAEDWRYVYTADDERIWSFKTGGSSRWTLRDLGNSVLREYANNGGVWTVTEDFIHRGGQLLAADTSSGVSHFHLDHLGTPRLVTNQSGVKTAYHVYWPYGEELTLATQDAERMKFTGHERDLNGAGGVGDDLDYMHARFCSPVTARFLSADPGRNWDQNVSQSWNLYTYVRSNPVKLKDPTGKCSDPGGSGTRICVQTFIAMATFGPFAGDGRGARSDGGTFRSSQMVNLAESDSRIMTSEKFDPGKSEMGSLQRQASAADHEVVPTAAGLNVSAAVSDGLLYGAAPNLEYNLTIATEGNGNMSVSGSHTAFPSLEVFAYQDGKEPQQVYVYNAPADNFLDGVVDINRTVKVAPPQ